ncbi:MAG TPA: aldehyde ferredoxin oxidoreductase N-terminal domain-containing protein, partial [Candidatus Binatia bacterium]|nr:aldehyde ferredoxin oxidoreductase N-terminal domain-containing protein [Candidatus Binatia bacterium]
MHGFHGRLLHIDLSLRQSSWHELEAGRLRAFLGGIGLGASLLYEWAPPRVDPFAPENPLIFASAPLVGTGLTTTAKFAVVTKSPLTGFVADSLSSSHFALELKRAGIDALVVTGRAESLSYVFVDRGRVVFGDAAACRGRSAASTEAFVRTAVNAAEA